MKPHESKNSKYIKILQEIYGSKYSYAELETLVWAGLHETAAFKAKFDTPEKVKDWENKYNELKTKCVSPCKK